MASVTTEALTGKRCAPCEGGVDMLSPDQVAEHLRVVDAGWALAAQGHRIRREWISRDFVAAIDFFNEVAKVAESEGHHPDLHLSSYRNVAVEIWTHAIGGLSENDFILAAKIDRLPIRTKS